MRLLRGAGVGRDGAGDGRRGAGVRVPGRGLGLDDDGRLSRRVTAARPATNVTTFVGHNTLGYVVGSANRPPSPDERTRMVALVERAMDDGARGFTTGLSYAPGLFASVDELATLAAVAARRGLTYHTHMRYGVSRSASPWTRHWTPHGGRA